jgi:hypothetical protein
VTGILETAWNELRSREAAIKARMRDLEDRLEDHQSELARTIREREELEGVIARAAQPRQASDRRPTRSEARRALGPDSPEGKVLAVLRDPENTAQSGHSIAFLKTRTGMDIRQTREAVDTLLARGYIEVIDDGWYRVNPAAVTPIEEA